MSKRLPDDLVRSSVATALRGCEADGVEVGVWSCIARGARGSRDRIAELISEAARLGRPALSRCPKPRDDADPSRPAWVDEWVDAVFTAERRIRRPPKRKAVPDGPA